MTGVVYLVGAGPGDPGLLTRRGAELLARADVVVYDRLVGEEILELAPSSARRVYAGKMPGESGRQSDINQVLVDEARAGHTVVRLKGGDPFLFGRGGEECEVLRAADVPYEVVPGVSAVTAAPAYAGIPLTHREHASWVAIAAGYEDPTKPASAIDWGAVASAGTSVFLMARTALSDITKRLMEAGRDPLTPATMIASATLPAQAVVRSTLASIAADVELAGIDSAATLVVGDVSALGERLDWVGRRPLQGMRVFVPWRNQPLAKDLAERGAVVLQVPVTRFDVAALTPFRDAVSKLVAGEYGWIVLASQRAVWSIVGALKSQRLDARAIGRTKVAAVGPVTARALANFGVDADIIPDEFTAEGLLLRLGYADDAARGGNRRVLLPRAEDAPDDLVAGLRESGWDVDVVAAYRTVEDDTERERGGAELDAGVDAILFSAGSAVRAFVHLWGQPPKDALVCCIGPSTAAVCREEGVRVDVVAEVHTGEGLVRALVEAVRG